MDPLTQGALGAAVAQSLSPAARLRLAGFAGFGAGLLADADVVIRSDTDALLFLDYHRHFTHALAFIPVGGAVAAGLCVLLARGRARFRDLFWPCVLGYATHGLLDSCTSYGTFLFWPFSDTRVAWHVISIIDPLFTVPLVLGVVWALWTGRRRAARVGLGVALAYLALCVVQQRRALAAAQDLWASRGHTVLRHQVKPSFANSLVFRALYEQDGTYRVDGIRVPWLGAPRVAEGETAPALDRRAYAVAEDLDPVRTRDLDRFADFSRDWLVLDPLHPGVVGDARYAMLPTRIAPLWGVDVAGTPPGEHLRWAADNGLSDADRQVFLDLLWGRF